MRAALVALRLAAPVAAAQPYQTGRVRLADAPAQGALVRGVAPAGTLRSASTAAGFRSPPTGASCSGSTASAGPAATLSARLADGARSSSCRWPSRRAPGRLQRINMARPADGPTPEYARLRAGETGADRRRPARLARDSLGWAQAFIWPGPGTVQRRFGSQRVYRGGVPAAFHSGTDIAAGAGALVVAPADGVVVLAPPPGFSLEGNLVIVDHGMGLSSAFLHLVQRVGAGPATEVRQGQPIGRVGMTGRATGPHLHWSVVWNGVKVDPATVVVSSGWCRSTRPPASHSISCRWEAGRGSGLVPPQISASAAPGSPAGCSPAS